MLLAPFLWISCEFDEKVLDNLSLVKLICTCATIKKNRMLQKFTAEMLQSKAKSCRR